VNKTVSFSSVSDVGQVFAEAVTVSRRGGGLEKIAGARHPAIEAFLRELRPDPRYQYVLMTPMGASDYWGMNVNGDYFPEMSLAHDRGQDPQSVIRLLVERYLTPHGKVLPPGNYQDFGHKTFLDALRYRHHINKDPSIAYGNIVCSVWNPAMQRVEVVARHDRQAAARVGASDIIADIDEGRPRHISMGCKVPFDVCTVCGNMSRTQNDYCDDLRTRMGAVLPNGKLVAAVNLFPRFFDLSDVIVPAAKESGVLQKVAEVYSNRMFKRRRLEKEAEIEKQELPNTGAMVLGAAGAEKDLPREALRLGGLKELLSTLSLLGIVLKPREFQYRMLREMGQEPAAEKMWDSRQVFHPCQGRSPFPVNAADYSPSIARALSPLLARRSAFAPHLPARVIRITVTKQEASPPETRVSSDALNKVASMYDDYREGLVHIPEQLPLAMRADSQYFGRQFLAEASLDSLSKAASEFQTLGNNPTALYVYNAFREDSGNMPRGLSTIRPNTDAGLLWWSNL